MPVTFKVLLLGDSGVGKTTLRTQFLYKAFSLTYRATIGANFITKQVAVRPVGTQTSAVERVSLCLWDTAGQERFNALGPSFYRGADAAVLVYDCTRPASLDNLRHHLRRFFKASGTANPVIVLAGNKADLGIIVTAQQARMALGLHKHDRTLDVDDDGLDAHIPLRADVTVFETSARTGIGVDALFRDVAERCRDRDVRRDVLAFDLEDTALTPNRQGSVIKVDAFTSSRCAC